MAASLLQQIPLLLEDFAPAELLTCAAQYRRMAARAAAEDERDALIRLAEQCEQKAKQLQ